MSGGDVPGADVPTSAPSPDDEVRRIDELLARRRLGAARALIGPALAAHPGHTGLLFEAARLEAMDDAPDEARALIAQILQADPTHLNARWLLVHVLLDAGDLPQAEEVVLGLLREYPEWAELYAAYARVMLRALKLGKARELCAHALQLAPDSDAALRTMALLDMIEQPDGAASEPLRRLLAQQPDDQNTLSLVVASLSQQGRTREALHGAQQLLRAQPDNPVWLGNVRELRYARHWSMWPLRPLQRYGWGASIGLWLGGIVLVRALGQVQPSLATIVAYAIFGYAVYSWVWPPILRRILLRR